MDPTRYQLAMMSQNQGQQPMKGPSAPMPPMQEPMMNPALMVPKNPINEGTRAGMKAAKQSLALDEGDKSRAMGSAIMNFFANMAGSQSRSRSNAVGQSLLPAVQAYQQELTNRQGINETALALQLKREREAQAQENSEREFQANQDYRNRSLALQEKRLGVEGLRLSGRGQKNMPLETIEIPGIGQRDLSGYLPIETTAQRNKFSNQKQESSRLMTDLGSLEKDILKLKELSKDDTIRPDNPYLGSLINPVTDIAGYALENKTESTKRWNQERILRKKIEDKMFQVRTSAEKGLKGGDSVPLGMMKMYEMSGALPKLSDGIDVTLEKISTIKNSAVENRNSADLSLKTNRIFDTTDLENLLKTEQPQVSNQSRAGVEEPEDLVEKQQIIEKIKQENPDIAHKPEEEIWQMYQEMVGE